MWLPLSLVQGSLQDLRAARTVPRTPPVTRLTLGRGPPVPQCPPLVVPMSLPPEICPQSLPIDVPSQVPPQVFPQLLTLQEPPLVNIHLLSQPTVTSHDMTHHLKMPTMNLPMFHGTGHLYNFLEKFKNFVVANGLAEMQII